MFLLTYTALGPWTVADVISEAGRLDLGLTGCSKLFREPVTPISIRGGGESGRGRDRKIGALPGIDATTLLARDHHRNGTGFLGHLLEPFP